MYNLETTEDPEILPDESWQPSELDKNLAIEYDEIALDTDEFHSKIPFEERIRLIKETLSKRPVNGVELTQEQLDKLIEVAVQYPFLWSFEDKNVRKINSYSERNM